MNRKFPFSVCKEKKGSEQKEGPQKDHFNISLAFIKTFAKGITFSYGKLH